MRKGEKNKSLAERVCEENKPLVQYRLEKGKGYYNMSIPTRWRDINKIQGEKVPGRLFYSSISKGYFLWVTPDIVKKRLELKERSLDIKRDIKELIREKESKIPSPAALDLLRLELFSSLVDGCEKIKVKCKHDSEMKAIWRYLGRVEVESPGIINKVILRTSKDPENMVYTINVEKTNGLEAFEYDYISLTEDMLSCMKKLFSHAIGCIENSIDEALFDKVVMYEYLLDFLWAYGSRQLVKGINRGVFCGKEYSGTHAVGLGGFYKLLEHAIDDLVRILQLLYLFKQLLGEQGLKDANNFLMWLANQLRTIKNELDEISDVLLASIVGSLKDEDYEKIAMRIKKYNIELKEKLGATAEVYLLPDDKWQAEEYKREYFGEFIDLIKTTCNVNNEILKLEYTFLLSQLLIPLQKIARFPRNIAIFARFIAGAAN